jgi:glycosyltransferase involved in cell wall biosynthesis
VIIREWVKHGETGLVVPVGDAGALANELLRLVDAGNLRKALAGGANRLVMDRGSHTRNLEMMEQIYLKVVGGGDVPPAVECG